MPHRKRRRPGVDSRQNRCVFEVGKRACAWGIQEDSFKAAPKGLAGIPRIMTKHASIIIADETALFVYMHISSPDRAGIAPTRENPLSRCASTAEELRRFNSDHPFYGGHPISVLVRKAAARRQSSKLKCRYCDSDLPAGSFFKLREGLYIASPELVFLRMADLVSEIRLIEIGINLCGRYYISLDTGKIDDRDGMLTSPAKLAKYLEKSRGIRGARKAERP